MSDDLRAFLLARIEEDETVALDAASVQLGYSWPTISWLHGAHRAHGKRWAPERVLAECEAKRRIVEAHPRVMTSDTAGGDWQTTAPACATCRGDADEWDMQAWPCPTLCLLALPYSDHPDYDEAWRP